MPVQHKTTDGLGLVVGGSLRYVLGDGAEEGRYQPGGPGWFWTRLNKRRTIRLQLIFEGKGTGIHL